MKNVLLIAVFFLLYNYRLQSQNDTLLLSEITKEKYISPENFVKKSVGIPYDVMIKNLLKSVEIFNDAIRVADSLKMQEASAELKGKLGIVYYFLSEYDLSVKTILEAIRFYEKTENFLKAGQLYASMGYQMKRRNLNKAFEYMRLGISYLNKTSSESDKNSAINNFGVLHEMKGDLDSAMYYYNQSLNIVEKLRDSVGIPYSLNNIAGVYVLKAEYDKALPLYQRAFEIRKKRNDLNGITENYTYIGDWYFHQKKYNEAIQNYLKGYEYAVKINYPYLQQVNAENLSKCYEYTKKFEQAFYFLNIAKQIKDSLNNESNHRTITWLETQFGLEKKEKEIAKQIYNNRIKNIVIIFIILLTFVLVLFFISRYKNLKIKKEQEKQKELQNQRDEISRELHDNIGSNLTFISSTLDYLYYQKPNENDIKDLSAYAKETLKELRQTVKSLNTQEFTYEMLYVQIEELIKSYKASYPQLKINLEKYKIDARTPSLTVINIFRIVKEALNNIAKHASAKNVWIKFCYENNKMYVKVKDDGVGFDTEKNYEGNGIKNMKARIRYINAQIKIISEKNKGTEIIISI